MVEAITCEVKDRISHAAEEEPTPEGCPPNRRFVPTSLCSQVIHWAHMVFLPAIQVPRELFGIKHCFW